MSVENANDGYRSFARGGIAAVIAINTLALGAVLSQLSELRDLADTREVYRAFIAWIVGVALGVLTWLFAALAAQAFANDAVRREAFFGFLGYSSFLGSLVCFIYGSWRIAIGAFSSL
jgi:hypothetical protein